jgi:hypothetical protein
LEAAPAQREGGRQATRLLYPALIWFGGRACAARRSSRRRDGTTIRRQWRWMRWSLTLRLRAIPAGDPASYMILPPCHRVGGSIGSSGSHPCPFSGARRRFTPKRMGVVGWKGSGVTFSNARSASTLTSPSGRSENSLFSHLWPIDSCCTVCSPFPRVPHVQSLW